jgi:ribonuclease HII
VQWQIGIDEAGRGALAGPVCVGAVLYPSDFDWHEAFSLVTKRGEPRLRDSKQLSAQQRGVLFEYITSHARLRHAGALVSAESIDAIGIVNAAHEAVAIAIQELGVDPKRTHVLLDAGLRAPQKWQQDSFVRGDETIPAISFASIVAKVTRDRYMEELAHSHASYGFEGHKGYGTQVHMRAIRKFGILPLIHRKTFVSTILA